MWWSDSNSVTIFECVIYGKWHVIGTWSVRRQDDAKGSWVSLFLVPGYSKRSIYRPLAIFLDELMKCKVDE